MKWEPEMKITKITVNGCARCGESHEVEFLPFAKSVIELDDETLTHWGMCPNLNEPILMRIETKPDIETPRLIEEGG